MSNVTRWRRRCLKKWISLSEWGQDTVGKLSRWHLSLQLLSLTVLSLPPPLLLLLLLLLNWRLPAEVCWLHAGTYSTEHHCSGRNVKTAHQSQFLFTAISPERLTAVRSNSLNKDQQRELNHTTISLCAVQLWVCERKSWIIKKEKVEIPLKSINLL